MNTDLVRDLALLHPLCKLAFQQLAERLEQLHKGGATKSRFLAFETFRHPARQQWLLDHTKNTKAGMFQSAHQFGMAVDFVPFTAAGKWSWDPGHDWELLKREAERFGLRRPIDWDKAHIESPAFARVRDALAR